ncbi:MAG TPA: hypothetical protein VFU76_06725 [Terriglobales bacterium]|nr:hypothetical protein [Terriglobales bacterium]
MREFYRKGREGAQRAGAILRATLREIFEESAYERFLQRNAIPPSRAAYEEFAREMAVQRQSRPRCC